MPKPEYDPLIVKSLLDSGSSARRTLGELRAEMLYLCIERLQKQIFELMAERDQARKWRDRWLVAAIVGGVVILGLLVKLINL